MIMDGDANVDDQIKADIVSVRASLLRSGCKTRFAAVLLSEKSIVRVPELEDRLTSIRRATNLDSKSGLFFQPPMSSSAEIDTFVHGIFNTLQPLCVEYYRDLTKHARRKKARGSVPASNFLSSKGLQALTGTAWNARYEVKQGVFAEFRQEMDVAERHYSQAIEDLFNQEGTFEITPSWSPRWNEARLLSDALALRVVRCQLWNGLTSGATQSWSNYRARMRDLVNRRGKGSQTYSWDAWESRWTKIMAELVQRADLPILKQSVIKSTEDSVELSAPPIYAPPEKTFTSSDRMSPFHMLHHAGYWLRLATSATRARWKKSLLIPAEDRLPPGQSPASAVVSRSNLYDHYLVPEPDEEYELCAGGSASHINTFTRLTNESTQLFSARGQNRLAAELMLAFARELAASKQPGDLQDALDALLLSYNESRLREDEWHDIFDEMLSLVQRISRELGNAQVLLSTAWETLYQVSGDKSYQPSEFMLCLDEVPTGGKVSAHYRDGQRRCPIAISFAFASDETHVGEGLSCQLTLLSMVPESAREVPLSRVLIKIGNHKTIEIAHAAQTDQKPITTLILQEEATLHASADLKLRSGQLLLVNFALTFRDAREFRLEEVAILIEAPKFELSHSFSNVETLRPKKWLYEFEGKLESRELYHSDATTVTVLPKPPKLHVALENLRSQYYVGEQIRIVVRLTNGEAQTVNGTIRQTFDAPNGTKVSSRWLTAENSGEFAAAPADKSLRVLEELVPGAISDLALVVDAPLEPASHTLTFEVDYTLASEQFTPLKKTLVVDVVFATLFEAKFALSPLLHPDQWPSYFDSPAEQHGPEGVPQLWRVGSKLRLMADCPIVIESTNVTIDHIAAGATCTVQEPKALDKTTLHPQGCLDRSFEILTRKQSLDDRRPTVTELSLEILWRRDSDSTTSTAVLPIPRLSIPSSEPRVLCTTKPPSTPNEGVTLLYHLENPSAHFLTFALTMEASDEFAFSGPKHRSLSLAPLSRHCVEYQLVVHAGDEGGRNGVARGVWVHPSLQVLDSYYQKTLRVQAAGEGVSVDAKGVVGAWVPANAAGRQ